MPYRDEVLADAPGQYWRLGDGEGSSTAEDETANDRDGSYGSVTHDIEGLLVGDPDTAVLISTGSLSNVLGSWDGVLGSDPRTVELWVQTEDTPTGLADSVLVSWGWESGVDGSRFTVRMHGAGESPAGAQDFAVKVDIEGGGFIVFSTPINDGEPHHIVVVLEDGKDDVEDLRCWLDGVEDDVSASAPGTIDTRADGANQVSIARLRQGTFTRRGPEATTYDELAVYPSALSPARIAAHFDTGSTLESPHGEEVGDAPIIRVSSVLDTSIGIGTDPLSEYLEVHHELRQGGAVVDEAFKTGSGRHEHTFTGLTPDTDYRVSIFVRREAGWSPRSDLLDVTTLASSPPPGETLGCPPVPQSYWWNPDSNPPGFDTWRGTGWFVPYPGQPLRDVVTCSLRWPNADVWDVEISDDLGATYAPLASDVNNQGADGDNLQVHSFLLDTTGFADGMDYRLRATAQESGVVVESLSFAIDNAELMGEWSNREGEIPEDKFGVLWGTEKIGNPYGDPVAEFPHGDKIWWRESRGNGIAALRGQPWSSFVDREIKRARGGDVTVRFYLWTGEGGFAGLQGMLDCEGWRAGISFFTNGRDDADTQDDPIGPNQSGLFIGLENFLASGYGCCDDYYTSVFARLTMEGRSSTTQNWGVLQLESDPTQNSGVLMEIDKIYHNSYWNVPRFITSQQKAAFVGNRMLFRDGHVPGALLERKETCGRRYSMYSIRARVELDPLDTSRVRTRIRVDGPGVQAPDSGYWHVDDWWNTPGGVDFVAGALGMASIQNAQQAYGSANGARVFLSWSAMPLEPEALEPTVPAENPEPLQQTFEGRPCTLVLQAYEEDRETLAWEVGTDPDHLHPYLVEPEHYGEQEIDIVDGAATIGQVDVMVVDKAQIAGDQSSGWVTERLSEGGLGVIHGRRFRLIRFISDELGWVVIADGPAGTPRLDESYAAYRWTIRDTRETERKVRAFVEDSPSASWVLPMGVENGFGQYENVDGEIRWLVDPAEPLEAMYTTSFPGSETFVAQLYSYWGLPYNPGGGGIINFGDEVEAPVAMTDGAHGATLAEVETTDGEQPVDLTWPDLEVLWRFPGETAWNVVTVARHIAEDEVVAVPKEGPKWESYLVSALQGRTLEDGTEVPWAAKEIVVKSNRSEGVFPEDEDIIEIALRWVGEPNEVTPAHIEFNSDGTRVTAGQLVDELYSGLHSPRDPVTGEPVPTGILYKREDVLQLTDPVRLRITESISDVRDWTEKILYQPTGWVPALDRDLHISPISQVPPDDFSGELVVDDAITEPQPNWDAGETIVNVLQVEYPRYFPVEVPYTIDAVDQLQDRKILVEFRDEASITNHGEETAEIDAQAFAAIGGGVDGAPLDGVEDELGWQLAQLRRLYVFDRYRNGAQVIHVPVRRDATATLRPGNWCVPDLTWIPDYVLRRRGGVFGGQILAIKDVDCAWRVLLIEEALPVVVS